MQLTPAGLAGRPNAPRSSTPKSCTHNEKWISKPWAVGYSSIMRPRQPVHSYLNWYELIQPSKGMKGNSNVIESKGCPSQSA